MPVAVTQRSLFGLDAPSFDHTFAGLVRRELSDGAWVDHQAGWLAGHDTLFDTLVDAVAWEQHRRTMYDRVVDVPRLTGSLPADLSTTDGEELAVIAAMADAFSTHYGARFDRVGFALYRDGRDSVAWHGDQVARDLHEAMVITVSLGSPRAFGLRPKGGGPAIHYRLGHGDLMVMGGTCQRTWDHCIPKVARAEPRLAIMFRSEWASSWSPRLPTLGNLMA